MKYRVKVDGAFLPADLDPSAEKQDAEAVSAWWRDRGFKAEVVATRHQTWREVEEAEIEFKELLAESAGAVAFGNPENGGDEI